jgi:hypothetical protein
VAPVKAATGEIPLNNIVEQDYQNVKRLTRPGLGFGGFWTGRRTLSGYDLKFPVPIDHPFTVGLLLLPSEVSPSNKIFVMR